MLAALLKLSSTVMTKTAPTLWFRATPLEDYGIDLFVFAQACHKYISTVVSNNDRCLYFNVCLRVGVLGAMVGGDVETWVTMQTEPMEEDRCIY